jgi:hypothetical protein
MAIPPEPLESVLPKASWVVEAEVKEIVSEGRATKPPAKPAPPGSPQRLAAQVLRLAVKRVLRGPTDTRELVVHKPVGAYRLGVGNKGPFLLDAGREPEILGRYGPDSYSLAKLEAALRSRQK